MFAIILILLGVPMCATEDSPQCVWVAEWQGNGSGHDVLNLEGDNYIVLP